MRAGLIVEASLSFGIRYWFGARVLHRMKEQVNGLGLETERVRNREL